MGNRIYMPSYPTPANGGGVQPGFRTGGFGGGAAPAPVYPTLPQTFTFEDGTLGDFSFRTGPSSYLFPAPTTVDSHTPSYSKVLEIRCNAGVHGDLSYGGFYNAGLKFDISLGIRWQVYGALLSGWKRRQWQNFLWEQDAGWFNTGIDYYVNTNFASPNDKYFLREIIASSSNIIRDDSSPGTGRNMGDYNPHWVVMNFEITADAAQAKYYETATVDGTSPTQTETLTKDFSSVSLDTPVAGFRSYDFEHRFQVAHIWFGTSSDAFPTPI
jgi:hypothetical protein